MKKKLLKNLGIMILVTTVSMCNSVTGMASDGNYENWLYTYQSSKDGDYKAVHSRQKDYSGTNIPHGYVYAIASEGSDSSIEVRKKLTKGNEAVTKGYVTVPYMKHTCIRNTAKKLDWVYLRVRINQNSGITSGYWSPDCSKQYPYVVG